MPRKDADEKLRGEVEYVGDMVVPGMLQGKVLRSPLPHARIRSIDVSAAERIPGVVAILTGDDFLDRNPYWGHAIKDRPIVAIDKVRHVGEPVVAVAAIDEATADAAIRAITVDYEELPVAGTILIRIGVFRISADSSLAGVRKPVVVIIHVEQIVDPVSIGIDIGQLLRIGWVVLDRADVPEVVRRPGGPGLVQRGEPGGG